MVRATRRMRSWDRAVRPIRSKADCIRASPAWSRRQNSPIMGAVMWALQVTPVSAKRAVWTARAASTRRFTSAELSGVSFRRMDAYSTAGTLTWRSIRSSRGPEIFSTYLATSRSEQVHRPEGCPRQPHRQGFMAHTSWNRAGRCSVPQERATVTVPSSRGWRMASSTSRWNSGSSSRNSTPLWAREISPGRSSGPPPVRAAAEAV